MPRDHIQVAVNQERDVEPKALDALGDLADLLCTVLARVVRVRLQALNGDVVDRERRSPETLRWRLRRHGWRRTFTTPARPDGVPKSASLRESRLFHDLRRDQKPKKEMTPVSP